MDNMNLLMVGCTNSDVEISYTNYKGETAVRRVHPLSLSLGESKWHSGRRLFLLAYDLDKEDYREFDVNEIHDWKELKHGSKEKGGC